MASAAQTAVRRTVKTCTECRQSKLKCDSKERFPSPCSRCEAKQLFCNVDAAFKRTPAKKRLEAMARELQELRSRKEWDAHTHMHDSGTDPAGCSASSVDNRSALEDAEDDFDFSTAVVSLGDVFIQPQMAVGLFRIFAQLFRPQMPILGPLNMDKMYESNPLLFWTIISIVLDHSPTEEHALLGRQLRVPYTRFLQQQMLSPPLSLQTIQAFLLIIEWPLGVINQVNDPSWLYCGVAIQGARLMSLDRQQTLSSLRSIGVSASDVQARINTWLGCFYTSTALGMHMGLPALIESELDFTVVQDYLRQSTMPLSFTTCVRVQLVVSKFISLLNRDLGEAAGLSLIRLFDADLAALRPEGLHDEAQSRFIEFCVLDAKIHFYTLFITKTAYDSTSRAIMLRSAFSAALRIINLATSEWHGRPDAKHDEAFIQRQRSFSKGRYRCICLATVFLLKFFHNNSNSAAASQEERQLAANHICLAGEQFKACSINPADEYARIASLFEILARMKPDDDEANRLRLTHRMGVSIVLDAVSNANEIHNRRSESAAASASGTVPGHHHGHHGHHHHHSHLDDDEAPEHLVSTGETSPTDPVLQQQQQLQHDVFRQQQQFQDPFAMAGPDMMRELWTDPVLSMIDFDQAFYMGDFTA